MDLFLKHQALVSFFVKDKLLCTPALSCSLLNSITRSTILALASDLNIPVSISCFDRSDVYLADEVFVCGSAAEITPIIKVDGFSIGSGSAGSTTLLLLAAYHQLVTNKKHLDRTWSLSVYD